MEASATISDDTLTNTYLYHQLDEYPWDSDQEFQGGLRAILGSVEDPAQVEHLTLRAKCYYYARKAGTAVDFEGYRRWVEGGRGETTNGVENAAMTTTEQQRSASAPVSSTTFPSTTDQTAPPAEGGMGGMGNAPYSASFAEICDMIAEGKPIPGIKDIPDTILEGQQSESVTEGRKKPWEKGAGAGGEALSWMK